MTGYARGVLDASCLRGIVTFLAKATAVAVAATKKGVLVRGGTTTGMIAHHLVDGHRHHRSRPFIGGCGVGAGPVLDTAEAGHLRRPRKPPLPRSFSHLHTVAVRSVNPETVLDSLRPRWCWWCWRWCSERVAHSSSQ